MSVLLAITIAVLSALSGSDTSFSCQNAKAKLGGDFTPDPVYFVLASGGGETLYLAQYDDPESGTYSVSFPEDGDALQGEQTFKAVEIFGERHPISNPLTVTCGQTKHVIFLPIVNR